MSSKIKNNPASTPKQKTPAPTKAERQQMLEQQIYDNWQATRDLGKFKYVLHYGVIQWGLFTFVIYMIITFLSNLVFKLGMPLNWLSTLIVAVLFALTGVFYGMRQWSRNEKIFRKRYPYGRTK